MFFLHLLLLLSLLFSLIKAQAGSPWDAFLALHSPATASKFNAYCLDGTRGGMYIRPASSPSGRTKFKFHFQGGGWSFSEQELLDRSTTILGSSSTWPSWLSQFWSSNAAFYGLMGLNDTSTSYFGDWTFVWLAYCDGSSQTSDLDAPLNVNGVSIHLRGRALLDAHMETLDELLNFTAVATEVLVSGTSAGGLSTHLHSSFFAARVPSARTVSVPDAAWWWDTLAYNSATARPILDSFTPAIIVWNATIRGSSADACFSANPTAETRVRCWVQPYQHAFSTVPTFHVQSLYDTANLAYCYNIKCSLGSTCNAEETTAIQSFHLKLLSNIVTAEAPFGTRDGHFFTSCSQHEESCRSSDWFGITIGGGTMNSTLTEWYLSSVGSPSTRRVDVPWPGDATCTNIVHGSC
jgi:hypothetical protein